MNTKEINKLLKNELSFVGTFPRDNIPFVAQRPSSFVVNTDHSTFNGQHWIAFHVDKKNVIYYFDSYGRKPIDNEIKATLRRYTNKPIKFSDMWIQGTMSDVCGEYCVLFILYMNRGFSMQHFLNQFSPSDTHFNDQLVRTIVRLWKKN